jgi:hypothetical protein
MTTKSKIKNREETLISILASEFDISYTVSNGEFSITIDYIHIEFKCRANLIILYTDIYHITTKDSFEEYKKLLSLSWNKNTYFEEVLSIDKESQNLFLSIKIDTQLLTNENFLIAVENFLNTAEYFSKVISKHKKIENISKKNSNTPSFDLHNQMITEG